MATIDGIASLVESKGDLSMQLVYNGDQILKRYNRQRAGITECKWLQCCTMCSCLYVLRIWVTKSRARVARLSQPGEVHHLTDIRGHDETERDFIDIIIEKQIQYIFLKNTFNIRTYIFGYNETHFQHNHIDGYTSIQGMLLSLNVRIR